MLDFYDNCEPMLNFYDNCEAMLNFYDKNEWMLNFYDELDLDIVYNKKQIQYMFVFLTEIKSSQVCMYVYIYKVLYKDLCKLYIYNSPYLETLMGEGI